MALLICQDVQCVIGSSDQQLTSSNKLNSFLTSNILTLHNCGIKKFLFVFLEDASDFIEELVSFFCSFLPDCILQFQEEKNKAMGIGDIILSNYPFFSKDPSFLVCSWKNVPSPTILNKFLQNQSQTTSFIISNDENPMLNHTVHYDSQTNELLEVDGVEETNIDSLAVDCGVYLFQTSSFSKIAKSFPTVHPTSALSLLHHLNQQDPHSISVFPISFASSTRTVEITVETTQSNQALCLLIDGALIESACPLQENLSHPTFRMNVHIGSTLRYLYGTKDELSNLLSYENRAIPREVYISNSSSILQVHDVLSNPLQSTSILRDAYCILISLERWRIHQDLVIRSASIDASSSLLAKCTSSSIIYYIYDGSFYDIEIEIEDKKKKQVFTLTVKESELNTILTSLSIQHQDGILYKQVQDHTIELKVCIIPALPSSSSSLIAHQVLSGYSYLYSPSSSPLLIGHRGCGVNRLPTQTEVENSLHGFAEAASRGLSTVEFDLQCSKDQQVMVFHDYSLPTQQDSSIKTPLASLTQQQLQSLALPSPSQYKGSVQHMPTMKQMITSTPASLNFNIEVKYPMPTELAEAQLTMTKNQYIDTIINTVEATGSNRMIYYSSFDPEICYSLLYKQARYPVFLLIDEESGCKEISKEQWIRFTWKTYVMLVMEKGCFRGVVAAIPLLDGSSVKWLHSRGLVVYCWGADGNRKEKRDYLKTIGVDGIIADTFRE